MEAAVIILDGHLKSALAAVRSLGQAGKRVVVGSPRRTGMALHSRYASVSFVYPDPRVDRAAFLVVIKAEVDRLYNATGIAPVLYTFSDATCVSLAESLSSFGDRINFPLPSSDAFKVAFNKRKTAELAVRHNIPVIPTLAITEAEKLTYPVVIKPPQSVSWHEGKGVFGTAEFIFGVEELKTKYSRLEQRTGQVPIIQQLVSGEEYGVELICRDGEVVASFIHWRVRSLSPSGGAAVVKQTAPLFHVTEVILKQSLELARTLVWNGPIMFEWKVEKTTDTPYLMEINGRFWGSLPLAVQAGVDFPLIYYNVATKQPISTVPEYVPVNVRTRHFWGDAKWLFGVLFHRTPLRRLMYPRRVRALRHFVIEPFRSSGDVWRRDDPKPSIMEIIDIIVK